jgi:hypothetical protein
MKQGGYAKPGKVIYVKNGKETKLCALDQNHHLIEVKKDLGTALWTETPVLSALIKRKPDDQKKPKGLDIDLWHKRLGHLGLDNVRKTAELTRGIKLNDNPSASSALPCEACSLAKPARTTRKVSTKRVFNALSKI